ncbi:MAG TPA: metal ABC transporter permease, partial [Thermoanaerobaculia bacterium]
MPGFLDALSYEFLRNALLAGVLASVLCGVIGTFVVVKKLAFISDGISHAAFGGMGLCFFLGIDPLLGAIPVALACAFALGAVDRETIRSYDALIGVLWSVGMAVGVV